MKIVWKVILLLIVCLATWHAATTPWVPVLDDANLIFHEAGHVIFSPFGELLYTAGGSIFQILLPLLLVIPFVRKQDYFGALLMLWWAGENMIGVGRYIADARAQELELIGGEHDFALILSRWPHVMRYDTAIGGAVRDVGITIMLVSIAVCIYIIFLQSKDRKSESVESVVGH